MNSPFSIFSNFAVRADGMLFGCGYNSQGEVGVGTTSVVKTYVQVTGVSNVVAVSGGSELTLALRSDGFLFACGRGNLGGLGTNSTVDRSTFIQCLGISSAVAIGTGGSGPDFSFALNTNGVLYGTGNNSSGQLGLNDTANRSTFVPRA